MRFRIASSIMLMVIVINSATISEDDMKHRIEFIPGMTSEEAGELVKKVWEEEYEHASVMPADVDGDGQAEVILAIRIGWPNLGFVAIFRKQQERYDLWEQIAGDGSPAGIETRAGKIV